MQYYSQTPSCQKNAEQSPKSIWNLDVTFTFRLREANWNKIGSRNQSPLLFFKYGFFLNMAV